MPTIFWAKKRKEKKQKPDRDIQAHRLIDGASHRFVLCGHLQRTWIRTMLFHNLSKNQGLLQKIHQGFYSKCCSIFFYSYKTKRKEGKREAAKSCMGCLKFSFPSCLIHWGIFSRSHKLCRLKSQAKQQAHLETVQEICRESIFIPFSSVFLTAFKSLFPCVGLLKIEWMLL